MLYRLAVASRQAEAREHGSLQWCACRLEASLRNKKEKNLGWTDKGLEGFSEKLGRLSLGGLDAILAQVAYPGFTWHTDQAGNRLWLRASFVAPCNVTGEPEIQWTRRWYVSHESTRSEVVLTALKCVLTSVEHEARENFKYRGKMIFHGHIDVDTMWEMCDENVCERRTDEPKEVK